MKKLLFASLAVAMGATCVWSLAACDTKRNDEEDAKTAQSAVNYIKTMYGKEDYAETDSSFQLPGKTSVGGNLYNVSWTVSTESTAINDITEYIQIGNELDEDYRITVTVERPTEDVEYTLTGTVKVGNQSKSVTIERTLKGLDQSDVFTVSQVLALDTTAFVSAKKSNTTNGKYYSTDGTTAAVVTIKGYVVDPGTFASTASYQNYNNIYIVNDYSADKDKDSEGAIQVYRVQPDGVFLKADGSTLLQKGDYVTFQGCIEYYSSKIQISYASGVDVKVTGLKRDSSDQGNVTAAMAAVKLASSYTAGEVDLPSTSCGANLTWALKSGTNVTINGTKMTVTNPDAETPVTVTVTIKSGSVQETKDITFTVVPTSTKGTAADPYNVAEVKAELDKLASGAYYQINGVDKEIYVTGIVVDAGAKNGTYGVKNVYIADSADADNSTWVLAYNINYGAAGSVFASGTLDVGDTITIKGYLKNHNGTKEICQSSSSVYPTLTALDKVQLTDAQKVERALNAVSATLVVTKAGETVLPESTVAGVTLVWSTTDTTYTVVGGTKLNVAELPATDATVQLLVTAQCGAVSENNTKTVTATIKADLPLTGEGTLANPYTVADVKALLAGVGNADSSTYYTGDGSTHVLVHVKGYVVVSGTWSSNNNNYTGVYIVDEYAVDKNAGSTDALQVYGLQGGTVMTLDATHAVPKGELITVTGYLQNRYGAYQVTYSSGNPTIVKTDGITDAVKVANAIAALDEIKIIEANAEGVALPESTVDGVTFTWSGTDTTYPVANNKITVPTLPAADTEVTLTLTVTCGDVTKTEEVKVIIAKSGSKQEVILTTLTFAPKEVNTSNYTSTVTITKNGQEWSITNFNNNASNGGWSSIKCGRNNGNASVANITTSKVVTGTVTKVTVTVAAATAGSVKSFKLLVSNNANMSNAVEVKPNRDTGDTTSIKAGTETFEIPEASQGANLYYQIVVDCAAGSKNGFVEISQVELKGYAA